MDYLDMIKAIPPHRYALMEDSVCYTYKTLAQEAVHLRKSLPAAPGVSIIPIQESSVYRQLVSFIAYSGTSGIPVIIPPDMKHPPGIHSSGSIPKGACMGVLTSGSTGDPSIWFRSFESWNSFFPIQNSIFGVNSQTRMFVHGSLAFTGNLNMCLALLSEGAVIITCTPVHPPSWRRMIQDSPADAIYMIPSKLRLLGLAAGQPLPGVKIILSGSQSLGFKDIKQLKHAYPQSRCFLYYGASELSYVSYLTDLEMDDDPSCIGRPFPGVQVMIWESELYVDTPYLALGLASPCSVGDLGYIDGKGYLHYVGRKDNVYNIHGRKISALKVENALLSLDEVLDAAVAMEGDVLTACVVLSPSGSLIAPNQVPSFLMTALREYLEIYELPRRILCKKELKKNSSGKTTLSTSVPSMEIC